MPNRLTPSEWQEAQAQADSFFAALAAWLSVHDTATADLIARHEAHKERIERQAKRLEAARG